MHIEPGEYRLKQDDGTDKLEVGKLVVVATPEVKEYWYLYTVVPDPVDPTKPTYRRYTVPSKEDDSAPSPGTSPTARRVTTYFEPVVPAESFDATKYVPQPVGTGFQWMEISCACRSTGVKTVPEDRPPRRDDPQIDWEGYMILQRDEQVGYVYVQEGSAGNPIESWTLFMKIPGKDSAYQPPDASGGHYTLEYASGDPAPIKSLPDGTEYVIVEADCNRAPLFRAPS
jgi:hypothetical protein